MYGGYCNGLTACAADPGCACKTVLPWAPPLLPQALLRTVGLKKALPQTPLRVDNTATGWSRGLSAGLGVQVLSLFA